jgi:hypothetical protein
MASKSVHHLLIYILALCIFFNVISSPISISLQKPRDNELEVSIQGTNHINSIFIVENRVPMAISQDNTTDTTNTTTTPTTTTDDTNTTTKLYPGWKPLIDDNLYYPLAIIFSILGILSTLWLIFFVETSKDRTIQERIIGSTIRLVLMSILLGLALHFWILFEPI